MTRRRSISDSRLRKLKGKEGRTLVLLGGVVVVLIIVMMLSG